jgi:hypothetical protein
MTHRIAIVVPTYQRNELLFRLLNQLLEATEAYRGRNHYVIHITDSDSANPAAESLSAHDLRYHVNPGRGFDDNLLSFYGREADYDYVLSISDDDLLAPLEHEPLTVIDQALESGHDAYLFNHANFVESAAGITITEARHLRDPRWAIDSEALRDASLRLLPKHVGLAYSRPLLTRYSSLLPRFRDTLHLYAAPFLLACSAGTARFVDEPIFLFRCEAHADGAWSSWKAVFDGLARFLHALRTTLSESQYSTAREGFFTHYLGRNAWLRRMVGECEVLASPEEIVERLSTELEVQLPPWTR